MKEQQLEEFSAAMYGLGKMYSKHIDDQLIEMYWNSLERFDYKDVSSAYQRHYNGTGQASGFFPRPGQIIELIEGSVETRAQVALSKLTKAIGSPGVYSTVCFDDPVINKVVQDLGGWVMLGKISGEDFKFYGNRFVTAYRGVAKQESFNYPKILTGISDAANNERFGGKERMPMLVGKRDQALIVYKKGGSSEDERATLLSKDEDLSVDEIKKLFGSGV
ncbi:MAG: hypothetical protein JKY50_22625 [Oleispira sp.]|nr:hypothetical protein [Oleispira sp.]